MRFAVLALIAFAGVAMASPVMNEKRDFISELGKAIKEAEDESGLTAALQRLDDASKGRISDLEDEFGLTALENALNID
ncbi:unnamed protein product [Sympodiomycopsis kandeliae]